MLLHNQRKNPKKFSIYQSVSVDGGKSFSVPVRLLGECGGAPAHLMKHSSGVLISTYGYREQPYGIRAMLSKDGGKTWQTDLVLWDKGVNGDLGYPCSVELSDEAQTVVRGYRMTLKRHCFNLVFAVGNSVKKRRFVLQCLLNIVYAIAARECPFGKIIQYRSRDN